MSVENTAYSLLESRTPFAWLRERDIDLLFCSELHARGALARLLATKIGQPDARLSGAWVSHSEIDGESDLVVIFKVDHKKVIALIENKIATSFQPEQPERYIARARRWAVAEGVTSVATILLAPAEYMRSAGAENFDHQISYEEAAVSLNGEQDSRSTFFVEALLAGVRAYAQGYVMKPDQNVTDMWMACWHVANRVAPALRFPRPGTKPAQSTWIYFRQAEGFSTEDRRRVVIAYKAERGQVDLQFSDTNPASLAQRAKSICDATMKVEPAGKSASIRVEVPKIDFSAPAESQPAALVEGFATCERLRAFFMEHRLQLLGVATEGGEV